MWDHDALAHKDAVHVATALVTGATQLDTFDGPLIRLSGQIGNPPLVIGKPNVPEQLELGYFEEEETEESENEDLEE